jgi:GNAT superfamily N-acetyltransferase
MAGVYVLSGASIRPRAATRRDVDAIVVLVNRAYDVEHFFVRGDRVTPESVQHDLDVGTVFVVELAGSLSACVFTSLDGPRGYFGMLAVNPEYQGQGLGRALIRFVEQHAAARAATTMGITVVDVRTDLIAFYQRLGYQPTGTAPYVHRPVIQPVHFIVMEKQLQPNSDVGGQAARETP